MKPSFFQAFMAWTICIIVVVGYGFWYTAVGAKSVAVANLENKIVEKTGTANRLASSRASLAEIAGDEATIQNYFVPETGVVAFIDSLQERGNAQGAVVSVLSVSATDTTTAQPALMLSLTVSGAFDAVMRTIGAIEYAPYDLTVSSLSVTQGAEGTWRADVNILVGSVSATQSTTSAPAVSPTALISSSHAYF